MNKQNGQSAVEFALMAPIVFLLIFAMIYGGIMFMDYLNFNNQARTIAREIALAGDESNRENLMEKYNQYKDIAAGIYAVSFNVSTEGGDVLVRVDFKRDKAFIFIPEELTINYRMKME
ncbi:MAG: pilus assembly protein [Selenomonadaceae bacterium]|nr:pilus assembly protein [Selenomonadaceae bacterium]